MCVRRITVRSLLLIFLVRLTQLPMLYPDRNGTDSVSWPLKLGSHPRRSPAFHVFRGRPLFSRALLCPASISASHQEGIHGWPGPFSQILLSTRSGAPASNRTNIGGVYRLIYIWPTWCDAHLPQLNCTLPLYGTCMWSEG